MADVLIILVVVFVVVVVMCAGEEGVMSQVRRDVDRGMAVWRGDVSLL